MDEIKCKCDCDCSSSIVTFGNIVAFVTSYVHWHSVPLAIVQGIFSWMYGVTPDQLSAMLQKQGFKCAICRKENSSQKGWAIDHDHKTGKVRGILCPNCNAGLGFFKDKVKSLQNAIKYLQGCEIVKLRKVLVNHDVDWFLATESVPRTL